MISSRQKLTDEPWIAPYRVLARWRRYLGEGYKTQTYQDSQNLFISAQAAIYPAGSWELARFKKSAGFEMGAFPPPVKNIGDDCHISDHTDMGIGLNTSSPNKKTARIFLNWIASSQFASLYAKLLPGFFPLSNHPVKIDDPLAQTFLSWRDFCHSTIRSTSQILSRGTPNLEMETWNASVSAIMGTATPEEIGTLLQNGLSSWYKQ